jgi:RNA-directed DNA polymerase
MRKFINANDFLKINTQAELCNLLQVSMPFLEQLINENNYKEHIIQKAKGGKRQIDEPEKNLKAVLRFLNLHLQHAYNSIIPMCSHGFILHESKNNISRNIVTNASIHTNKRFVLNLDLKDFFHSITTSKVKAIFNQAPFHFNDDVAIVLALLCTYKKRLPMGAPTSPVLANLACLEIDHQLMEYCKDNGLKYTRYADDLTFSSDENIDGEKLNNIKAMIIMHGYLLNEKKSRLQSKYGRQTVTGIKVNEKVNVNREYIKLTRAMLHHWNKYGLREAVTKHFDLKRMPDETHRSWFINRVKGRINFITSVRGKTDIISRNLADQYYLLTGNKV